MNEGDLLSIANKAALHNRTMLDIRDTQATFDRWLLKTYAFEDEAARDLWQSRWHKGVPGLVAEKTGSTSLSCRMSKDRPPQFPAQ
jgi:L-asparagine oxygenase